MFKSRQLVFSTVIFALLPPVMLSGASSAVEYVGGTVKAIPANSTGAFNFDDAKELRFNYGASVYALPYEQITATDIGKVQGESHHILRKIPVPSFSRDPKETLTIGYKDAAGATGTLSFELTARQAAQARDSITIKKALIQADIEARSNEWWGDKIWKTNRNKALWEAQSAQTSQPSPSAATK
jgi:hypothetical protein